MGAVGTPVAAQEPTETDHEVPNETFSLLWSGDIDGVDANDTQSGNSEPSDGLEALATSTDLAFDRPPEAVDQWNRGDHGDFPESDSSSSVAPRDVVLRDGSLIKDAYVTIFAISPSTVALTSPTDSPHYVAGTGTVAATVDSRVSLPPPTVGDDGETYRQWHLVSHRVASVRLLVDGENESSVSETHTPVLPFSDLNGSDGTTYRLTVEATIVASVETRVASLPGGCEPTATNQSCVPETDTVTERDVERLVVHEHRDVTLYRPSFSGARLETRDGPTEVALTATSPWAGYRIGEDGLQGTWRFYSAREPRWDRVVEHRANGTRIHPSPSIPLQVYAYPSAYGPRSRGPTSSIVTINGTTHSTPALTTEVRLDVPNGTYQEGQLLVGRHHVDSNATLSLRGLVRETGTSVPLSSLERVERRTTDLRVAIIDRDADRTVVQIKLRDAATDEPIATQQRGAVVRINDQTVNTDRKGTAVVAIPSTGKTVATTYVPAGWWEEHPAYAESSDTLLARGVQLSLVSILSRIGLPVGLFCLAMVLIGRITGWQLWPPWEVS